MSKKKEEIIIERIEKIFEEFNDYKKSRVNYRSPAAYYDAEEGKKITKLYTKAKILVESHFGKDSEYSKQIESHTSTLTRNNLELVIGDLEVLYENLKSNYLTIQSAAQHTLKYEEIIEDINLNDSIYQYVINEINGTYISCYFTSMYILIRKLLENLLYDCLQKFYGVQQIDKYYDTIKNQHHGFGTLIKNFNEMIKNTDFKAKVGDVEQGFIDLLKEFQEKGNKDAHSLFNLPHQDYIEDRKDKINELIKKLNFIKERL